MLELDWLDLELELQFTADGCAIAWRVESQSGVVLWPVRVGTA